MLPLLCDTLIDHYEIHHHGYKLAMKNLVSSYFKVPST